MCWLPFNSLTIWIRPQFLNAYFLVIIKRGHVIFIAIMWSRLYSFIISFPFLLNILDILAMSVLCYFLPQEEETEAQKIKLYERKF